MCVGLEKLQVQCFFGQWLQCWVVLFAMCTERSWSCRFKGPAIPAVGLIVFGGRRHDSLLDSKLVKPGVCTIVIALPHLPICLVHCHGFDLTVLGFVSCGGIQPRTPKQVRARGELLRKLHDCPWFARRVSLAVQTLPGLLKVFIWTQVQVDRYCVGITIPARSLLGRVIWSNPTEQPQRHRRWSRCENQPRKLIRKHWKYRHRIRCSQQRQSIFGRESHTQPLLIRASETHNSDWTLRRVVAAAQDLLSFCPQVRGGDARAEARRAQESVGGEFISTGRSAKTGKTWYQSFLSE